MTHIAQATKLIEQYMVNYNCLCYFDHQCILDQFAEMEDYDACIAVRDQMKSMKKVLPILNNVQQQDLISIEEMLFNLMELIQHFQKDTTQRVTPIHTPQLKILHTIIADHPFELTKKWSHCDKKHIFTIEKMSDCPCEVDLLKTIPQLFDKVITLMEKQQNGCN